MWIAIGIIAAILIIFAAGFLIGANNSGRVKKYKNAIESAPAEVKAWAGKNGL
jgi:hypothetical protein